MLPYRDEFLIDNTEGLAICGLYLGNNSDSIHVGIFWNNEGERKIVHFQNGNYIPVENVENDGFNSYFFNPLVNFPKDLIPSLSAIAELVSQNKLNGFIFNRIGVVYAGGKFEYKTGAYTAKTGAEKFVNCAVFVIALLKTFDYTLLDWDSWPNMNPANLTFLNTWLEANGIPQDQREAYYNQAKELRGKHVIVCPNTQTHPSHYDETNELANNLINDLSAA